jgi:anthranilate/para-aminobenzoate synthase component I
MYFYNFGDMQIVGASPEILVRNETLPDGEKRVTLRPIAGTRPRGATRSAMPNWPPNCWPIRKKSPNT